MYSFQRIGVLDKPGQTQVSYTISTKLSSQEDERVDFLLGASCISGMEKSGALCILVAKKYQNLPGAVQRDDYAQLVEIRSKRVLALSSFAADRQA